MLDGALARGPLSRPASHLRTPQFRPARDLDTETHRARVSEHRPRARRQRSSRGAASRSVRRAGRRRRLGDRVRDARVTATCPCSSRPACSGVCSAARCCTSAPRSTTTATCRGSCPTTSPGCFAMTETGHGSDVQSIGTTATYDAETRAVRHHAHPTAGAQGLHRQRRPRRQGGGGLRPARHRRGTTHGVHAFLVPIRDDDHRPCAGVEIEDCGPKAGLNGVDNGRLSFTDVRVPRDRTAQPLRRRRTRRHLHAARSTTRTAGSSRCSAPSSRAASAWPEVRAAATRRPCRSLCATASGAASSGAPGSDEEIVVLDYLAHQRRLLPRLATSYALQFAQNELVESLHDGVRRRRRRPRPAASSRPAPRASRR